MKRPSRRSVLMTLAISAAVFAGWRWWTAMPPAEPTLVGEWQAIVPDESRRIAETFRYGPDGEYEPVGLNWGYPGFYVPPHWERWKWGVEGRMLVLDYSYLRRPSWGNGVADWTELFWQQLTSPLARKAAPLYRYSRTRQEILELSADSLTLRTINTDGTPGKHVTRYKRVR